MLNKNIICIESSNSNFNINENYLVQEIQTEFCVRSSSNEFYKIYEIHYPYIKAKSLLNEDIVSFIFQS